MTKASETFGKIIREFLERNKLSLRAAGLQTGISAAYWNDMSNGRVPSEYVIHKICEVYEELDESALRDAAGLAPNWDELEFADAVALYLRHNNSISEEGVRQVIEFVNETVEKSKKRGNGD